MTHPTADEGGGEGGFERRTTTPSYYWLLYFVQIDMMNKVTPICPHPKGCMVKSQGTETIIGREPSSLMPGDGSDIYLKGCQ